MSKLEINIYTLLQIKAFVNESSRLSLNFSKAFVIYKFID